MEICFFLQRANELNALGFKQTKITLSALIRIRERRYAVSIYGVYHRIFHSCKDTNICFDFNFC